ncbi:MULTISPECIES: 5'-methylthioadenosine/S-adenosylhomocysteine nucleosidase [unclassified Streptomyces]|uniref:5'-methylthioadenosine/S-adenosylhomocysteine nucleosidase family protein n=1 Tax=unclassified Streptomyces TaxID=2593676 RepID=UPI00343D54BA
MLVGEFGLHNPVVVLTAIGLEYEAVRAHLINPRRVVHEGTWFEAGEVAGSGRQVVLAEVGPGNRPTAVIAEQARTRFTPRAIIFVGVAGSLKPDVRLGDVVVASRIYAYDGAKHVSDEVFARPAAWAASHDLLQTAKHALRGTEWTGRVRAGAFESDGPPTVHFKPVAAGETLLSSMDSELRERLTRVFNDAVAVEMESAGLAEAAAIGGVKTLTIRGISDYADGAKASADARGMQGVAAAHAAAAAMTALAALPLGVGEGGVDGQGSSTSDGAAVQGLTQVNTADRKGVVNAVQNGSLTINHHGPQATER